MGEEHVDPLDALRPLMESYSPPLHALVIPSEDAHQSEYVADRDKRREFVSHFTGSAGLAVITKDEALLWTDGRYFLQATQQLSSRWKLMRIGEDPTVETWLSDNLSKDSTVGVDPWCISVDTAKRWEQAFAKKEQKLIQLHHNLVDAIWENRPPERIFPVRIQSLKFTGLSAKEKIKDLRSKLAAEKAFAIVISTLDEHPVELEGLRNAHIRDGVAVVSYLAWLDGQMQELYGAAGYFLENGSHKRKRTEEEKLTEVSVSDKLEEFRSKQQHFMGLSFETISSVGSNAAIIHYAPKPESCAELHADSMYLCDSGGQYLDGTTDVTRTVHFGKPSAHEKECFTQVLQGHIGLDTAVFPNGTTGHALDILARVPLWKYGLDYRHGTGHGVGSFLNVHEGPHLISFRPQARNVAIQASMTVTDEPGYYEDGNFGIRLENVLIVKEARTAFNFGDKGYLAFEHITWVPFQAKLIDLPLLSPIEMNWVDQYHAECRDKLSPYLSGSELEWLVKATEPLPREVRAH
ncbi:hypothetical protein O6H91_12G050400 [Diphasiastrum complanatum]|uniref:Uncharacterized protein n=1 Tax=Diphasiastrum complanatum TaxID=34168 RepID=A0ACC2C2P7_DIPCM|nr:hypothetical protein O6H91_12G050400 [Diphasiastrum complanatum]